MSFRAALPALLGSSLLITGCALSDHYSLASIAGGGAGGTSAAGTGGFGSEAGADTAGDTATAGMDGISGSGGASSDGGGNTAGSGGAAVVDPCEGVCTADQTCCGSTCADLATDPANCGACGLSCNAGRTCAASACSAGWVKMSTPVGFAARSRAASAAMDKNVFIWGGLDANGVALDTGEIYSPSDDTWTPVAKGPGSPTPRSMATALWTGSVVIVYGGVDPMGNTALKDAAAYDPVKQTWAPMGMSATRRAQALGFWDGTRALFWGGATPTGAAIAGGDRLQGAVWSPSAGMGDPGALIGPAVAFDGSTMYVEGGNTGNYRLDKVSSYSFASDSWTTLTNKVAPTARSSAFSAWDGSHLVVWGGRDDNNVIAQSLHNDGKYLADGTWTAMAATGAPSARLLSARRSGWAFAVRPGVVAIVGGQITVPANLNGNLATDGGVYDVASNTWKAVPAWPSGEIHDYGVGVWTGEELVIWGGSDKLTQGTLTTTGERLAL